jgi:hypothetical protein
MSHLYEKQQVLQIIRRTCLRLQTKYIGENYLKRQLQKFENVDILIEELIAHKDIEKTDNVIKLLV